MTTLPRLMLHSVKQLRTIGASADFGWCVMWWRNGVATQRRCDA
jgi:hypothetical protein